MLIGEDLSEQKTIERIKSLATWKEGQLKELRSRIKKRRDRYYLDHYDRAKQEGEEQVHIAAEMRLVDRAHGLLMLERPSIKAYPEEETEPGLEESDRLEAWLEGVLYLQKRRQATDPFALAAMDMLIDSMACLFTYWDTSLDSRTGQEELEGREEIPGLPDWEEAAAEQEQEVPRLPDCPIVVKRRDVLKLLPEEGGPRGRWKWVMYQDETSVLNVEEEWGVELEQFKGSSYVKKSESTVKVIDCWSWESQDGQPVLFNTVVAGKQLVKVPSAMPKYEHMPFEIFFCRPTDEPAWERKGLPITAAMEKTVPELEAMWNALMRAAKLFSQLPPVHQGPGATPTLATGFGKVLHLGPEEQFGFMEWPGMPPDFHRMAEMLQDEVGAGGLGAPLMGETPASPSGYALALRGEAGTLPLVAPQEALSLAMTNVLQQMCSLAANYAPDHEMRIMGRYENQRQVFSLTGEQCEGFFIEASVKAQFPEDKDRKMAWGMQMSTVPRPQRVLDDRTILEDLMGYENAQRIKERRRQEMAEEHPAVIQTLLAEALEARGLGHWIPLIFPELAQPTEEGPPQAGQRTPTSMPVEGVPTQVMPQEQMGAMRSQEMGLPPKSRLFPEEELYGLPFPT